MKRLTTYVQEKLIINQRFDEKLIINKNFNKRNGINITEFPKDSDELKEIIEDRYNKLGPGTEDKPIDFNDIDTSNITKFGNLFNRLKFEYIDISSWNTSRVVSMENMFYSCENLVSIGDIGEWDVRDVVSFRGMFFNCGSLENIGDLSDWEVTDKLRDTCGMFNMCHELTNIGDIGKWDMKNVGNTFEMFNHCNELEYIGDISEWDLGSIGSMANMFRGCKNLTDIGDLTKWQKPQDFKKNHFFENIFAESSIKNIPHWAF